MRSSASTRSVRTTDFESVVSIRNKEKSLYLCGSVGKKKLKKFLASRPNTGYNGATERPSSRAR